jgi:hypothetical protein
MLEANTDQPVLTIYNMAGTLLYTGTFTATSAKTKTLRPNIEVDEFYMVLTFTTSTLNRISRMDMVLQPLRERME